MNYSIVTIPPFDRQLKRLIKKFPSLKKEVAELGKLLTDAPASGTPLGNNCYKVRLSIASKGKGKSGGARIITHLYVEGKLVYLLAIYDKSEQENIPDAHILALLKIIKK
ncbi:type II toxin-antitoxin system RelE/ParE family toxin [Microcystis sp. M112S1]|jgi:mRNA-degrading endonuclease RelE of RelBE toxin-antitoxin system|uniref:type II toxin-antitoxin system RelE/ParE family toxin n=1 Tax=Microcystis sp. M112S1 TaxID=2771103 RepID=UPI002590ED06|nr:type II toxin-antitoxin system RelE/ParE family toxin [Microcystis sp. M112S1]MCA2950808.1 type II toxin-antitoxin system RelE/ParE family toxin [Microcystis sp. M112S1]